MQTMNTFLGAMTQFLQSSLTNNNKSNKEWLSSKKETLNGTLLLYLILYLNHRSWNDILFCSERSFLYQFD